MNYTEELNKLIEMASNLEEKDAAFADDLYKKGLFIESINFLSISSDHINLTYEALLLLKRYILDQRSL